MAYMSRNDTKDVEKEKIKTCIFVIAGCAKIQDVGHAKDLMPAGCWCPEGMVIILLITKRQSDQKSLTK
jgi:hypothetical protein